MDTWNSTYSIKIEFTPFILHDASVFVWDNDTNGYIPPSSYREYKYFWIGMSFIGGLVLGFVLHFLYYCLHKYVLSQFEDEYPESGRHGVTNLSFIGDDSRLSFTEPPPDYATVVSGNNEGGASSNPKETRGFLRGLFKRFSGGNSNEGDVEDEPPPSYSSVMPNLEVDFSVRWQSDDAVSITMTECPTAHTE